MNKIFSFLKKSNRNKHLIGGLLVGLCALAPWAAIYSAIVAASCLELKDRLYGNKFDLKKYVDKDTGLISEKSKSGVTIKALELPGLWNGSMSDWNTVFVEVPIATFNPVKTVNDLLRPQHQG